MLIQTREQFDAAVAEISAASFVTVDTETDKTTPTWQKKMLGVAIMADGCEGHYFPFRHEHEISLLQDENLPVEWIPELKSCFANYNGFYLAHSMKFDLHVLANEGLAVNGTLLCTLLIAHMTNQNHMNKSLAYLSSQYLEKKNKFNLTKVEKELGGWTKIPPALMGSYAVQDLVLSRELFDVFWPRMIELGLTEVWKNESTLIRALVQMEKIGLPIKKERAKELAYLSSCRLEEIRESLGFDPGKPAELARKLFAAKPEGLGLQPGKASTRNLKPPLTTPYGVLDKIPGMDKHYLKQFSDPLIDTVLEFRTHVKAYATWFQGFLDASDDEGRIHADFRQDGTVTGRFSCADPNLQQLPRTTEEEQEQGVTRSLVKTMLTAPPGYELWEFDYSQIEFRLAICYGQDEEALEAYRSGSDMHQVTADKLGIPRNASTASEPDGKKVNFTLLYGGGVNALQKLFNIDEEESWDIINGFWVAYPNLKKVRDYAESRARKTGYVGYWDGYKRHFQWPSEHHKAFNSIMQGGAGRIVSNTMVRFYRNPFFNGLLTSQVHDALWFLVPTDTEELKQSVLKDIKETMEWPSSHFILPFPVDSKLLASPLS